MIKIIFFDFDGTLYSHITMEVCNSAQLALQELKKKGYILCLASGRAPKELRDVWPHPLPFDYSIYLNGQLTLDKDGNVIDHHPINKEDAVTLTTLFNQKQTPTWLFEKDDYYCNTTEGDWDDLMDLYTAYIPKIQAYTSNNNVYQISIMFRDPGFASWISKQVKHCSIFPIYNNFVDIVEEGGSKSAAAERILELLNISKDEVMSFGDAQNDIGLAQMSNISVATGKAVQELKDVCTYVSDDIEEDGIYKLLKELKMI